MTVPAGWATYSDEISGFSLSLSNEWVAVVLDEAAVADLLASVEDRGMPAENSAIPFQAAVPLPNGDVASIVTVVVEVIPDDEDAEGFASGTQLTLERGFSSYVTTEQVRTVVGNSDSVILQSSYALSDLDPGADGRVWMVTLYTTDGAAGWSVACGRQTVDASAPAPDLEECNTIVRTFELSGP